MAASQTKKLGSDFKIENGGFKVGGRRGGNLTISADPINSRTADDILWRQVLTESMRDWSLDLDGMYIEASGSTKVNKYIGRKAEIQFDDGSGYDKVDNRTNMTVSLSMDTNDATDADSGLWMERMEGERTLSVDLERHWIDPRAGTAAGEELGEIRDAILGNTLLTTKILLTPNTILQADFKPADTNMPVPHDGIVTWSTTLENATTPTLTLAGTTHSITAVDTTGDIISISGDETGNIAVGDALLIHGSTGNNGVYTVSAVSYDSTNDETDITMNESITDSTADGSITWDYNDPGLRIMLDSFFKDPPESFSTTLTTGVTGADEFTGTGWVTDMSFECPHDSEFTFGGTLTGDGTLTNQATS